MSSEHPESTIHRDPRTAAGVHRSVVRGNDVAYREALCTCFGRSTAHSGAVVPTADVQQSRLFSLAQVDCVLPGCQGWVAPVNQPPFFGSCDLVIHHRHNHPSPPLSCRPSSISLLLFAPSLRCRLAAVADALSGRAAQNCSAMLCRTPRSNHQPWQGETPRGPRHSVRGLVPLHCQNPTLGQSAPFDFPVTKPLAWCCGTLSSFCLFSFVHYGRCLQEIYQVFIVLNMVGTSDPVSHNEVHIPCLHVPSSKPASHLACGP
jgi:hypothetical protein